MNFSKEVTLPWIIWDKPRMINRVIRVLFRCIAESFSVYTYRLIDLFFTTVFHSFLSIKYVTIRTTEDITKRKGRVMLG